MISKRKWGPKRNVYLPVVILLLCGMLLLCLWRYGFFEKLFVRGAGGLPEGQLRVHVLDVGQGDSIFIELPKERCMLIDAANAGDAPRIIQYIRNLGYEKLDYVVATHPHSDHIGGMEKVLRSFEIGSMYMPKVPANTDTFGNMIDVLQAKGVSAYTARAGTVILTENGLKIDVLSPAGGVYENANNYSAVVKIQFGDDTFLFMGDAEQKVEETLRNVNADFLKVGHHGSSSSSSMKFLRRVTPRIAVISVGAENTYGHPAQATIDNLKKVGAEVYLTAESGTLVFRSDGTEIWKE